MIFLNLNPLGITPQWRIQDMTGGGVDFVNGGGGGHWK